MVSFAPVLTTLVISVVQFVIFILFFELFRSKPKFEGVFFPRDLAAPHRSSKRPPKYFLSWVVEVWRIKPDELLRCVGMDTYVFLRFIRLLFCFTTASAVICSIILFPLYATGGNPDVGTEGYNSITIANISNRSGRLWGSLVCFYINVIILLTLIWQEWKHYLPLRYKFLATGDPDAPKAFRYAIFVENVPPEHRSSTAVFRYFDKLFPGNVASAHLFLKHTELNKLVKERQDVIVKLEAVVAKKTHKPAKGEPKLKVGAKLGCVGGARVDAVPHLTELLAKLNAKIDQEHAGLLDFIAQLNETEMTSLAASPSGPKLSLKRGGRVVPGSALNVAEMPDRWRALASSAAIVQFRTLAAKQAALQTELSGRSEFFDPFPAPDPTDVIWNNVTASLTALRLKRFIANAVWTVGILFWAIPVGFVQAVANLESLSENIGVWIPDRSSVLYGLLSGYLPVIALIVLMTVLPLAIQASAVKFAKVKSVSEADRYTFMWHFGFQVANLWLVLIGGSLFNQFEKFVDKPQDSLTFVAAAIPGASQFFMNILITQGFGGLSLELSRLVPVILSIVFAKIFPNAGKPQRKLDQEKVPGFIKWGWAVPPLMLNAFVALVYGPLVPLIQPFAAAFFFIALTVWRHQALHVYKQASEGGGNLWPLMFNMIMGCLYMSEIIFVVFMGIKKGVAQGPIAIVSVVLTVLFHLRVNATFAKHCKTLALSVACEVDARAQEEQTNDSPVLLAPESADRAALEKHLNSIAYVPPQLNSSRWETKPMDYRVSAS